MQFPYSLVLFLFFISCGPSSTHQEANASSDSILNSAYNIVPTEENEVYTLDSSQWLVKYVLEKGPAIAPTYQAADCVQFMDRLFNPIFKFSIQERNALAIRNTDIRVIRKNIKNNKRTMEASGIVGVLVNRGLAIPVEPADLQAGDIIQYWYSYELTPLAETPAERIFGHTGIVANNPKGTADLQMLSSARTNNGFSNRYLSADWPYQIYACRLKQAF